MSPTVTLNRLLVVAEPWASLLVDGDKTWELRTTSTKVRSPVGIAAKGTGTIIGMADLVDVHGPFTPEEIAEHRHLHGSPTVTRRRTADRRDCMPGRRPVRCGSRLPSRIGIRRVR